jgi:hypothetical protein
MRTLTIGVFGMLALASSVAPAQEAPSCLKQLDRPTADSVRSTFAVTVQSFNPQRRLPAMYAGLYAEGLRQELKLPPGLVLPVFEADSITAAASPSSKRWMAVPSMSVVYGVTVDSGKITRIRRIAGASDPAFDIAVARSLATLDSIGELPPLPDSVGPGPLEMSFAIARVPARQVRQEIPNPGVTTPLFIVLSPAYVVERPIARGADFGQFIPEPPTKRADEGVSVRVVVDAAGVAEQTSMHVVAYSSAGYIRNVFEMIPNWHFQPLVLNGCPVPAIEELTFTAGMKGTSAP